MNLGDRAVKYPKTGFEKKMSNQKNKLVKGQGLDGIVQPSVDENAVRCYEAPVLVYYGDVRDVTLGPTVGIGESGNELGRRP